MAHPASNPARILTTHVGSLPRPQAVVDQLVAQDEGRAYDPIVFQNVMREAVLDTVRRQAAVGVDVVSDGEMSKISYATYIRHRLTGFEVGEVPRTVPKDLDDFPDYKDRLAKVGGTPKYFRPVCKGPIAVKDHASLRADLANLREGVAGASVHAAFMPAASPGVIAVFQPNEYYPTHEAYLYALADAMRGEYEAIVAAGFLLQIDAPDLAMGRHIRFRDLDDAAFLRHAREQVDALNHALANVPADRARIHICWGNYDGPHHYDVELATIFELVMRAKPSQVLFEASNARHAHEWSVWQENRAKIPDDKILVPGVLDSVNNFIEHPLLVAERICRYANIVGRDRVMAGSDCGYGTFAGFGAVHPPIAYAKLKSMREGADIATERLWGRGLKA